MTSTECPLCQRVLLTAKNQYPYLIHEFDHSYLMLGEHQYYLGYCVLVTKDHHREMADVPSPKREELFQEMMRASAAIQQVFKPKKMNLCSLGNVVEHLHWHFFPRYGEDENFKNPPWLQMDKFENAKVSAEKRAELIAMVKQVLD
ncbi:MAG TPA: HIT family protein [Bacteriovoracaceae bacterium]|nr:HIT family protein [Bacteriovoracaceae bacterium]